MIVQLYANDLRILSSCLTRSRLQKDILETVHNFFFVGLCFDAIHFELSGKNIMRKRNFAFSVRFYKINIFLNYGL